MAPVRQCPSLLSNPRERPYQFTYLAIHFGKIWKSWVVFFFFPPVSPFLLFPIAEKAKDIFEIQQRRSAEDTSSWVFWNVRVGLPDTALWSEPLPTCTGAGVISRNISPPHPRADAGAKQWLYRDRSRPRGTQHRKWVGMEETPAVK